MDEERRDCRDHRDREIEAIPAQPIGPRTIGHEDPGAASTVLILQALATVTAT